MVLIVTALMTEAAPLIEHYKLKKDMSVHAWQVFRNSEAALIVSGTGKVKSAMAAVYLLSTCKRTDDVLLLNVGFCGALGFKPGSLLIINKVTDADTGFDYYPDVFIRPDIPQTAICCHSKPVRMQPGSCGTGLAVDMESAGIMEAAKKFLCAHQVAILKIVSDSLSPENLDRETLKHMMEGNMPQIDRLIAGYKTLNAGSGGIGFEEEQNRLDKLSENLRFTNSMKELLSKAIRKAKLNGLNPVEILDSYVKAGVKTKSEGKKIFGKIMDRLENRSV